MLPPQMDSTTLADAGTAGHLCGAGRRAKSCKGCRADSSSPGYKPAAQAGECAPNSSTVVCGHGNKEGTAILQSSLLADHSALGIALCLQQHRTSEIRHLIPQHRCATQAALLTSIGTLQNQVFVWLSKAMNVCPQPVYVSLGQFMSAARGACTDSCGSLPADLVIGKGKLKQSLVQGLASDVWSLAEKVAVAKLLMSTDDAVLLSHLGSCTKVRNPCPSEVTCVMGCLHICQ